MATGRRVHGFRPSQGSRLSEFGFRTVHRVCGRAELQDGDAILLSEDQLL